MFETLLSNPGPYADKVAWSVYFGRYITVVNYEDEEKWTFRFCSSKGRTPLFSKTYKGNSNIKVFEWVKV